MRSQLVWQVCRVSDESEVREAVYLGLGSNKGDRRANLRAALERLDRVMELAGLSSVYESEPVGYREQPVFWNIVARVRTAAGPHELLASVKRIERDMGRRSSFRYAPRVIDIDLLLYGDAVVVAPTLEVPHPRMLERAFVLEPLVELEPDIRHPGTGQLLSDCLAGATLEWTKRLFHGDRLLVQEGGTGRMRG